MSLQVGDASTGLDYRPTCARDTENLGEAPNGLLVKVVRRDEVNYMAAYLAVSKSHLWHFAHRPRVTELSWTRKPRGPIRALIRSARVWGLTYGIVGPALLYGFSEAALAASAPLLPLRLNSACELRTFGSHLYTQTDKGAAIELKTTTADPIRVRQCHGRPIRIARVHPVTRRCQRDFYGCFALGLLNSPCSCALDVQLAMPFMDAMRWPRHGEYQLGRTQVTYLHPGQPRRCLIGMREMWPKPKNRIHYPLFSNRRTERQPTVN